MSLEKINFEEVYLIIGAILTILILLFWFFKKTILNIRILKKLIIFFVVLLIVFAFLNTIFTFYLWSKNPLSKNLLPPKTPLSYFLRYSFEHYFFKPIVNIFFAFLFFKGMIKLNQKYENTFFYEEEPYLAFLGILITSWPNCLIYLSLVLFLGVFSHLFIIIFNLMGANNSLRKVPRRPNGHGSSERSERENEAERQAAISSLGKSTASFRASYLRLSLFYFWLPCALLLIILNDIINKWHLIESFKI